MRELLVALALLAVAEPVHAAPHTVCHFQSPDISESSDLVAGDGVFYTTNDSGDGPRVYVVDAGSCATLGTTTFADHDPVDVEALTPGIHGDLWVGDIGDNGHVRSHITVFDLPIPGAGDHTVAAPSYDLVYADGPRDAETLLANPATGRLFVVSKGLLGGTIYAAPKVLRTDRTNVLRPVGGARGLLTDGVFLPDGRHVLLRDYARGVIVQRRNWAEVGTFRLPSQAQGEGVAVRGRRVWVSSEGVGAAIRTTVIPHRLLRTAKPAPAAVPITSALPRASAPTTGGSDHGWIGWTLGAAWLALAAYLVTRVRSKALTRRG